MEPVVEERLSWLGWTVGAVKLYSLVTAARNWTTARQPSCPSIASAALNHFNEQASAFASPMSIVQSSCLLGSQQRNVGLHFAGANKIFNCFFVFIDQNCEKLSHCEQMLKCPCMRSVIYPNNLKKIFRLRTDVL